MKKPYKCPFCWNRYGYQHSRALHIEEDHKNVTYNGAKISSLPGDRLAQLDFKENVQFYFTIFTKFIVTHLYDWWVCTYPDIQVYIVYYH